MTTKIFSVAEMVAAEKAADASGNSYDQMMETAGRGVAQAVVDRFEVAGRRVLVLVGPGNNGGDGLVAGRYLAGSGAEVTFYLFRPRDPQQDKNLALVQQMGLPAITAEMDQRYRGLRLHLREADIIIDALLGTGVARPIEGELAQLLEQVHAGLKDRAGSSGAEPPSNLSTVARIEASPTASRPIIVAVDCPSGLDCDTGEADALLLPADLTVTFAGPKRGHFRFPGAAMLGELVVADIGIRADLPEVRSIALTLADSALARSLLPARPPYGHKGTFGSVLIVGGSERYWGAPLLCGRGAYRAGAGLVALTVPKSLRPIAAGQLPEATYPIVPETGDLGQSSARQVLAYMRNYKAMLVGPGLGEDPAFMETLLTASRSERPSHFPPLVIDADGLNNLAGIANWQKQLPANAILTPHPAEMARLMDQPLSDLKMMDRVSLAREKAAEWRKIIVLKGAFTVVAAPDGRCTLIPFANPILATAGSGDVLAGVILGLLGQGVEPYDAAVLGSYLHGAAGQLARASLGDAGLLASELADWVAEARRQLSARRPPAHAPAWNGA